jgi:hypothetical protein
VSELQRLSSGLVAGIVLGAQRQPEEAWPQIGVHAIDPDQQGCCGRPAVSRGVSLEGVPP